MMFMLRGHGAQEEAFVPLAGRRAAMLGIAAAMTQEIPRAWAKDKPFPKMVDGKYPSGFDKDEFCWNICRAIQGPAPGWCNVNCQECEVNLDKINTARSEAEYLLSAADNIKLKNGKVLRAILSL